jgi:homogentisate 1,2-dioxygenase
LNIVGSSLLIADRVMVRPGELFVIQAGLRWKVALPDGPSRGCE